MEQESEYSNALAELIELFNFYLELLNLSSKEMFERVEERYPSFIEHIENMEEPPKDLLDFWSGFGIWGITGLRAKYIHIWEKLINTYFRSEDRKQIYDKYNIDDKVWSQIDNILRNCNF